ncbi:hypothetical protein J6590_013834 [Homalodisca vitripennis]|nr:hypothetical protein J6590_013834 [Homalodisca vitripennis]
MSRDDSQTESHENWKNGGRIAPEPSSSVSCSDKAFHEISFHCQSGIDGTGSLRVRSHQPFALRTSVLVKTCKKPPGLKQRIAISVQYFRARVPSLEHATLMRTKNAARPIFDYAVLRLFYTTKRLSHVKQGWKCDSDVSIWLNGYDSGDAWFGRPFVIMK